MRPALALLLAVASLFATQAQAQSALQPIDRIVAVVDEDVILRSELDLALNNIRQQFAGRESQLPPGDILERQVLERLVMLRLQLDRANSSGVRVSDAELEQAVQNIAAQNRLTPDQLRAQIASEGLSYEHFRNQLRDEITAQRLQQRVAQSRVAVSETEIDIALAAQGDSNLVYRLANILVALPEAPTPEQVQLAQTKITGIKQLIERGEMDFAAAAIRYSDGSNALEGGDLGWRGLDEIPAMFANLIRGMAPGQISDPIRGPSGFQLVQVAETREQGRQTATEYRARHIMVRTSELVSPEQARAKIDQIRARIVAGEDFATLARELSDDTSTRAQGGDMGWFQQTAWGSAIGQQVVQLADGQVSEPFRTDTGWHLLLREGSREQDVTETNRRNQMREVLSRRKAEEEVERFMRQIRSEAFVDVRLGSD